jgi:hypothetical protein
LQKHPGHELQIDPGHLHQFRCGHSKHRRLS